MHFSSAFSILYILSYPLPVFVLKSAPEMAYGFKDSCAFFALERFLDCMAKIFAERAVIALHIKPLVQLFLSLSLRFDGTVVQFFSHDLFESFYRWHVS